ncbi:MAG: DNA-directed RNA polymerase subunit omega [Clostridiales bacterium]|nr:DNA-directed RNA polymerase subunit omega [Clostridiales bacterium]
MVNPPIDKLIDKVGCKFALVTLVAKRARYVVDKYQDQLDESNETALTHAAKEVYKGRVELVNGD